MNLKHFSNEFKKGMSDFNSNIITIINVTLLIFVYITGIGITSLIAKIFGKHFLDISKKDTYWSDLVTEKKSIKEHYKQF